jgi:hypothetical protein
MPDGLQPVCRMWRDALQPLDEAVFTPEILQFIPKLNAKRQDLSTLKTNVNISSKCLQASYAIFLCAAKCKTPHTIVQELVVPSAIEIASVMFDDKIVSQIKALTTLCKEELQKWQQM